jgi:glycogen synthase kinase 3 beta
MRLVHHQNIVGLKSYFYSNGEKKDEVLLNLVMDFMPETIYRASRQYAKMKQSMPMLSIKVTKTYLLLAVYVSIISRISLYPFAWHLPP